MTARTRDALQGSLPQLNGRLLLLCRALLCAFAIAAVVIAILLPIRSPLEAAVYGLRLSKAVVLITIAGILAFRRPRDPVAALLAITLLSWTITSSFDFGTETVLLQTLDHGRFLLFALTLLLFPDGLWQPGWTRPVAGCSVAVFLIGICEAAGLLHTRVFLPLAIACVFAGIGSLVTRFRNARTFALRQRLKWVALGLLAGVSMILAARAGLAWSGSKAMAFLWEALFQLGIMAIALGFVASLTSYRLFDAEAAISRSAGYALLTIALVATFGGAEALIENLGQLYLGSGVGSISGAMAAAVAAVLLNPLHGRITDWAEQRFQPDLATLKMELPHVASREAAKGSTRGLGAEVLPLIGAAVHATRCAMLVDDQIVSADGITLSAARLWARSQKSEVSASSGGMWCDPLFPVRLRLGTTPSGNAAWLLLGPRPDGTFYRREDTAALRSILPAIGQALTTTLAREAIDAAIASRERKFRRDLEALNARMERTEVTLREVVARGARPYLGRA